MTTIEKWRLELATPETEILRKEFLNYLRKSTPENTYPKADESYLYNFSEQNTVRVENDLLKWFIIKLNKSDE